MEQNSCKVCLEYYNNIKKCSSSLYHHSLGRAVQEEEAKFARFEVGIGINS